MHRTLPPPSVSIVQASQVVAMDEKPQEALRRKKDSSMRVAIDLVKAGEAAACVSAGNTGALMALAGLQSELSVGVSWCSSGMPFARGPWKRTTTTQSRDSAPDL